MGANSAGSAEVAGRLFTAYKQGAKITLNGTATALTDPTAMANYIVQKAYDGDTGQGQRSDLLQSIAHALALFKGTI
jgi:hypothetical protein